MMKISQVSVFLENKQGRLYEVCHLLGENNINIQSLIIAETEGFGVLRVVVDKPQAAMTVLKEKGFVANITDIVAVQVDDRPGGLADILKVLSDNNINVEYMYGFGEKFSDRALMVFRFEDPDKATAVLQKHQIRILRNSDIQE